jgi:hypothetical protein
VISMGKSKSPVECTTREEERILDVLGRSLRTEYPNPARIDCPPIEVLKSIATHEMPLVQAEKWLDHLGSCSPCYRDFCQFQAAYRGRHSQRSGAPTE